MEMLRYAKHSLSLLLLSCTEVLCVFRKRKKEKEYEYKYKHFGFSSKGKCV